MTQLADRTKLVKPSVTLAIAAKAGKLRASGIDVINFSAGEPDFDTPEHIKAAAVEALRNGMTKYTDVKGIEPLREAIAEKYPEFGILQIDAHFDLRKGYEGFTYSHASIMYNALNEIPAISKLVQVGIRDYSQVEWDYLQNTSKVVSYFSNDLKEQLFEGTSWKEISAGIVDQLPQHVYLSFDIDGLDPKLCPNTGTPVLGGLEIEQVYYLLKKIIASGRKLIGFDLSEVGVGESDWDANVGARILWKLCNILVASNS